MGVQSTLAERGLRYGDFTDHATIAQSLQDVMRLPPGWERMDDTHKQALTVIADKIARILSGDPNYADNWHDIQGYARLVEERLPAPETAPAGTILRAWAPNGATSPPDPKTVREVLLRDGEVIRGTPCQFLCWDTSCDYNRQVVGYNLVGDA